MTTTKTDTTLSTALATACALSRGEGDALVRYQMFRGALNTIAKEHRTDEHFVAPRIWRLMSSTSIRWHDPREAGLLEMSMCMLRVALRKEFGLKGVGDE